MHPRQERKQKNGSTCNMDNKEESIEPFETSVNVAPDPVDDDDDGSGKLSEEDLKKLKQTQVVDHDDDMVDMLPLREWRLTLPFLDEPISFNPLVSAIGVVLLWGLSIWSMVRSLSPLSLTLCCSIKYTFYAKDIIVSMNVCALRRSRVVGVVFVLCVIVSRIKHRHARSHQRYSVRKKEGVLTAYV